MTARRTLGFPSGRIAAAGFSVKDEKCVAKDRGVVKFRKVEINPLWQLDPISAGTCPIEYMVAPNTECVDRCASSRNAEQAAARGGGVHETRT
jgi:hypothetical protein